MRVDAVGPRPCRPCPRAAPASTWPCRCAARSPDRRRISPAGPSAMTMSIASSRSRADPHRQVAAQQRDVLEAGALQHVAGRVGVGHRERPRPAGRLVVLLGPADDLLHDRLGAVEPVVVLAPAPDDHREPPARHERLGGRCASPRPGWRRTSCRSARRRGRRARPSSIDCTSATRYSAFATPWRAAVSRACSMKRGAASTPTAVPPGADQPGEPLGRRRRSRSRCRARARRAAARAARSRPRRAWRSRLRSGAGSAGSGRTAGRPRPRIASSFAASAAVCCSMPAICSPRSRTRSARRAPAGALRRAFRPRYRARRASARAPRPSRQVSKARRRDAGQRAVAPRAPVADHARDGTRSAHHRLPSRGSSAGRR